ncbi:MAG: PspC domain-containing protein [Gammaproteobacteria bacterium]|nr:PspC domain-containing protein [Gammaproteobacteria bacterium]
MRDPERGKIGGVCAGLANYFGVETWVVRLIAVTGLIFLPSVMFPAYWIAFFVKDKPGGPPPARRPPPRPHPEQPPGGASVPNEKQTVQAAFEQWDGRPPRRRGGSSRDVSPAPELGHRLSPRRSLRHVRADFDQIELRLRRIETHITSGRYELQRELSRIERSEP